MTNGVKVVIAIGAVVVTTQLLGFVIGKKMMKFTKDVLGSLGGCESSPDEELFRDADGDDK